MLKVCCKYFVSLCLFAFLVGCSSSGKMIVKQSLNEKIPAGKIVSLSIGIEDPEKEKDEDYNDVLSRVKERLYAKLLSEGIFKAIVLAPEPADYLLGIKVKEARKVSTAARVMVGVMAGANVVGLSVKLENTKTNQLVSEFDVEGSSAAHPFSSEVGMEDAVRQAINNVASGLR